MSALVNHPLLHPQRRRPGDCGVITSPHCSLVPLGRVMSACIGRRSFIAALGGATLAWPLAARAQRLAGRDVRIGLLQPPLGNPIVARGYPAFLDELKKAGFNDGQNLTIGFVRNDQDAQKLFAETADLVRSKVELLVTTGSETALQAAMAASPTIPIVMWAINFDPIAKGYVKSLARPGGNVTGIVSLQTELAAKQVELLTEAFPERTRLAVLWDELRPTSLLPRTVRLDRYAWMFGR